MQKDIHAICMRIQNAEDGNGIRYLVDDHVLLVNQESFVDLAVQFMAQLRTDQRLIFQQRAGRSNTSGSIPNSV